MEGDESLTGWSFWHDGVASFAFAQPVVLAWERGNTTMAEQALMPFGKHKGTLIRSVPTDYLCWLAAECKLSAALRKDIAAELDRRGYVVPAGPRQPPPRCDRCGGMEYLAFWMEDRAGGRRIRAECPRCRRFMKFLSLTEENIAKADAAGNPAELMGKGMA
jgi:hypothetical protein